MAHRGLLHLNQVEPFAGFCEGLGWLRVDTKGDYEVLRMQHRDAKKPMILYVRDRSQHVSFGDDQPQTWNLVERYIKSKRRAS